MSRLLRGQGQNLHCRHPGPLQQAERGMLAARQRAPPPQPRKRPPARMEPTPAAAHAAGGRRRVPQATALQEVRRQRCRRMRRTTGARACATRPGPATTTTPPGARTPGPVAALCSRPAWLPAPVVVGCTHQSSARRGAAALLALHIGRGMLQHERLVSGQPRTFSQSTVPGSAIVSIAWRRPSAHAPVQLWRRLGRGARRRPAGAGGCRRLRAAPVGGDAAPAGRGRRRGRSKRGGAGRVGRSGCGRARARRQVMRRVAARHAHWACWRPARLPLPAGVPGCGSTAWSWSCP